DGCGTPVITFVNDAVNLSGCTETTTRTYKATDACSNTATCAQTITRTVDVTPPVITCPAPITVAACNGAVPAPDITLVTATDGCGTPVITSEKRRVGHSGCTETTTRTYKAKEASGDTAR